MCGGGSKTASTQAVGTGRPARSMGHPGLTCQHHVTSVPRFPAPHASPLPDRREKLRVRLTPSQSPGSSLMMPTLLFQVVQFTSSTLQDEDRGFGQQATEVPAACFQVQGSTQPNEEADKAGATVAGKKQRSASFLGPGPYLRAPSPIRLSCPGALHRIP